MSRTHTLRATPWRAAVVLYMCSSNAPLAQTMEALRRHATARDWVVRAELVDTDPAVDRALRPGWQQAVHLMATGAAEGLVAPHENQTAAEQADFMRLRAWLLDRGLFAVYTMPEHVMAGAI